MNDYKIIDIEDLFGDPINPDIGFYSTMSEEEKEKTSEEESIFSKGSLALVKMKKQPSCERILKISRVRARDSSTPMPRSVGP